MVNASLTRDHWTQSSAKCVLSLGMLCLCLAYGFWKNCREDTCTNLGCSSEFSGSPSGCSSSCSGCLFQSLSFSPCLLITYLLITSFLCWFIYTHLVSFSICPPFELTWKNNHRTNRTTLPGKAAAYIWGRKGPWDSRVTIWKCFFLSLLSPTFWASLVMSA